MIPASGRQDTAEYRKSVISRVTRRLVPFAFLCYVVAYIDRVNIGFAAQALQRDLQSERHGSTASAPASSSSATASSRSRAI